MDTNNHSDQPYGLTNPNVRPPQSPYAYSDSPTVSQGDYLAPPRAYHIRLRWSEFSLGRKLVVIASLAAIGSLFFPWMSIGTAFMALIAQSGFQMVGFIFLIPLSFVVFAAVLPLRGRRLGWMLRNPQWSDSRIIIIGGVLGLAWLSMRMLGLIEYAAIGYWIAVLALIAIMVGGWMMRQHGE